MPKKDTLRKAAYEKENVKRYALKLNVKYDAQIIERIEKQPSIMGYIKQLIREDIARNGQPEQVKEE